MDISIIIPTHKRPRLLKQCLQVLSRQDYPGDAYEVIVVSDGEDREAEAVVQEMSRDFRNLRYFTQKKSGPAAARNNGARLSLGKVIGFVDDDCRVEGGWIRSMVERHNELPGIAAVGGLTLVSSLDTTVLSSQFLANGSIETCIRGKQEVVFFPTCNVSFKRSVCERYSFDEQFPFPGGEDLEFFWRLFKEGFRFAYDRGIKVVHDRNDRLLHFILQAYIYGRGNALVQYLHTDHPLLKELRMDRYSFWPATAVNILKIPRFALLMGKRLIAAEAIRGWHKKASVYAYFILHKVFYILGNIREYIRIFYGGLRQSGATLALPRLLILDITHSCNLQCRICDIWQTGGKEEDISLAYIKKMLRDAKKLGVPEIALSGGEPLARKDIFNILGYARQIKIKNLGVLTNGILVGPLLEKLKPFLLENTVSLVVSLDSLDASLHNRIRNSPFAWEKTTQALNALAELKRGSPKVSFNVITIILRQNLHEVEGLARFVRNLGADSLQFQALLPNNLRMAERKDSPFWVSPDDLEALDRAVDSLIAFKKETPGFIKNSAENMELIKRYYRGTLTGGEVACLSGRKTVLVSNRGEYATCFSCYGNVRREGLEDVLKGKEIVAARSKVSRCSWPCLLPCFCDR